MWSNCVETQHVISWVQTLEKKFGVNWYVGKSQEPFETDEQIRVA